MKTGHIHVFVTQRKKILLHRYESQDGKMKPIDTTAYDHLIQRVCNCGFTETTDLKRTKL